MPLEPAAASATPPKRRFILTLVSGGAQGNGWAEESSALRREVADRLGDVAFETFRWSGDDSHEERVAAGQKLGARLEVQAAVDLGAHRVVIAPGHSGNVAMYAARNLADVKTMPDVVCVETPAFEVVPVKAGLAGIRTIQSLFLAFPAAMAVVYGAMLLAPVVGGYDAGPVSFGAIAFMLIVIAVFAGFGLFIRGNFQEKVTAAEQWAASLTWPALPGSHVLLFIREAANADGRARAPRRSIFRRLAGWSVGLGVVAVLAAIALGALLHFGGAARLGLERASVESLATLLGSIGGSLIGLAAAIGGMGLALAGVSGGLGGKGFIHFFNNPGIGILFDHAVVTRPVSFEAASVQTLALSDPRADGTKSDVGNFEASGVGEKIAAWIADLPVRNSASATVQPDVNAVASGEVGCFVTLVHGTYARGTAWTQPQSGLRRAIAERVGDVEFDVFEWSGANTHAARLQAGNELAIRLHASTARLPRAHHVVIAHSHGGNVALYAARRARDATLFPDIACLATPFLRVQSSDHVRPFLWFWGIVAALVCVGPFYAMAQSAIDVLRQGGGVEWAVMMTGVLVPVAFAALFIGFLWAFGRVVRRKMSARLTELAWPKPLQSHVLTMSYEFDEAGVFLRVLDRATGGASRALWRFSGRSLLFAMACVGASTALTSFEPVLAKVVPGIETWKSSPLVGLGEIIVGLAFVLGSFAIVLAYALPMFRGHSYGFGWEDLFESLFIRVDAVDRPDDLRPWSIENFRVAIGAFGKGKKMAHTVIYDDPRMQQKLADWIKATRDRPFAQP